MSAPFHLTYRQVRPILEGSRINDLCIQALRFGSDLADPTERNHRRSIATLRILRLRIGQRWPKSEMHQCASHLFANPLCQLPFLPGILSAVLIFRMNSARGISRAPKLIRCLVVTWQSTRAKSHLISCCTRATKATLEALFFFVNIDSPKNTPPSATP